MTPMKGTVARALSYTFGDGQAKGIDNVTLTITVDAVADPFGSDTDSTLAVTRLVTVQLPSAGWNEDDALLAAQDKFPALALDWEEPSVPMQDAAVEFVVDNAQEP